MDTAFHFLEENAVPINAGIWAADGLFIFARLAMRYTRQYHEKPLLSPPIVTKHVTTTTTLAVTTISIPRL
jgi:hypothetical protein